MAKKGAAVGQKKKNFLGSRVLPLTSVEGLVAYLVYGKLPGSSVYRRIVPIACLLNEAEVATNRWGKLTLHPSMTEECTGPVLSTSAAN